MAALLFIDGVEMPPPVSYSVPMQDLDSSDTYRNESGVLIRNRVRQGIAKIEAEWRANALDANILLGAIRPSKVSVMFYDPEISDYKTTNMYVGDRSCNLNAYFGIGGEVNLWSIKFNLIEY